MPAPVATPVPPRAPGVVRQACDVIALTGRNLMHIAREPLQLSDVTVQPVLFTLLFVYVFGAGVVLPGWRQLTSTLPSPVYWPSTSPPRPWGRRWGSAPISTAG